jgi:hypothetical protein
MAITTTYAKGGIPLRNLPPSSQSPFKDSNHSLTKVYTPSINTVGTKSTFQPSTLAPSTISTTRSLLPSGPPAPPFLPTSSLQIQTQGKALFRLPSPLKELTIPIFSPETGRPVYLSVREKRSSGNCRLVDAESEDEKVLASTTYHWGPGKNPVVRVGDRGDAEEFEILGKSMLSRSVMFSCKWGTFEWRYAGKKERAGSVNNLLVLERIGDDGARVRVAQLVRSEDTRSPGSTSSSAGNGGRLEMCLAGDDGEEMVDEPTVASTCLVMLKKEVDRRRAMQAVMISVAVSGGH